MEIRLELKVTTDGKSTFGLYKETVQCEVLELEANSTEITNEIKQTLTTDSEG